MTKRLFCEILNQISNRFAHRGMVQPTLIILFEKDGDPVKQTKLLIQQNKTLQNKILILKNEIMKTKQKSKE
jgi:hypothetical protein